MTHAIFGRYLRQTGWLAIVGCAAAIICNIIASLVTPGHDWVKDTISNLAAGQYAWIQDIGLYLFALGLAALGFGLWQLGLGGDRWKAGSGCLVLAALDLVVIAMRDEYGTPKDSGTVYHTLSTWLFGLLFVLALALLSKDLGHIGAGWRNATTGVAAAFLVLAPPFFLIPTSFDGLYERGLGLMIIGWIVPTALLLIRESRKR